MTIMTQPAGTTTVRHAKQLLDMEKRSELNVGEKWYVISNQWWAEFAQKSDAAKNDDELFKMPPISNKELVIQDDTSEGNSFYQLKPDLQLQIHIAVIPGQVFKELVTLFGIEDEERDTIAREVVTGTLMNRETFIEIYPLLIKVADYNNKNEIYTIPISQADSIEKIRASIMDCLSIEEKDRKNTQFFIEEKGQFEPLSETISHLKLSALLNAGSTVFVDSTGTAQETASSNNGSTRAGTRYSAYSRANANYQPGVCGLQNLGNTCFMNSALQCLSHVPELTEYFLNGAYLAEVNEQNHLGTQGNLVKAYAELLQEMWSGNNNSVRPWKLKCVIGEFAPRFNGYAQQDSQELMTFLLDGLHEDLNRIKKKPYIEEKEADEQNEAIVSREAWEDYKKRNHSIIVDLMHGQLKSTLICNICRKVSIKFDPFCFLSVPIPTKERQMKSTVTFIRKNKWAKFSITHINKTTIGQIKDFLKNHLDYPSETQIVMLSYFGFDIVEDDKQLGVPYNYGTKQFYAYATEPGDVILVENRANTGGAGGAGNLLGLTFPVARPAKLTRRSILNSVLPLCRDYFWQERGGGGGSAGTTSTTNAEDAMNGNEMMAVDEEEDDDKPTSVEFQPAKIVLFNVNTKEEEPLPEELDKEVPYPDAPIKIILRWQETKQFYTMNVDSLVEREHSLASTLKNVYTLKECIELYTTREQLNEEDSWYCPRCKVHQRAFKKFDLWSLPQILIIHLKRFIYSRYTRFRDKIDTPIEIPVRGLDLGDQVLGPERKNDLYDLISISNHSGGLGSGHYTARALNNGVWCEFNDSSAYPSAQSLTETLVSREAYMLVYRRSTQQPIRKSPRIAAAAQANSSSAFNSANS